jgi:hypothetical protein
MDKPAIDQVLQFLNALLDPNLSLHSTSYVFDNIAEILRRENMTIKVLGSKQYYLDPELHFIFLKRKQAIEKPDLEEAAAYRQREKELLAEKRGNEMTRLRTKPSFFEYDGNSIVGHLSKNKVNERLIINLIEAYNLGYNKK